MLTKQELDNIRAAVAGGAIKDELTATLLDHIAELEENATAQALTLKAAKAMQQAETERADANERDAGRYRWLRHEYVKSNIFIVHRETSRDFIMCGSRADFAIDQAMGNV